MANEKSAGDNKCPAEYYKALLDYGDLLTFFCEMMDEYCESGSFPQGDIASGPPPNLTALANGYRMADKTWNWNQNFVEIFDPKLLIPRAILKELADGSNGVRYAEWDVARLVLLPKNGVLALFRRGKCVVDTASKISRRCA
jgi:hypothetical protein